MNDTPTIKAFQIIDKNDTLTFNVDKKIIDHYIKDKSTDISHYVDILIPVVVALLTLTLTKAFDMWTENRRYKKDILKENRKIKIHFLKYLNTLKAALGKSHFPNADYEDFLNWIANKMVGANPFEDLKINANIIFYDDNELIILIDNLFNNSETINENFDWNNKEHPNKSLDIAKIIYDDLDKVIKKISMNLNY